MCILIPFALFGSCNARICDKMPSKSRQLIQFIIDKALRLRSVIHYTYRHILGLTWLELFSQGLDIRSFTFETLSVRLRDLERDGMISLSDLNFDRLTGCLSVVDSGAVILCLTPVPPKSI